MVKKKKGIVVSNAPMSADFVLIWLVSTVELAFLFAGPKPSNNETQELSPSRTLPKLEIGS